MKDEMPQADFQYSSCPNTDQTKKMCYFTEGVKERKKAFFVLHFVFVFQKIE